MNVRIRRQLRFQICTLGRVEGGWNWKEHRRYLRVQVLIQDPDRGDVGQGGNELLEPFAELGGVDLDGLVGAASRNLFDAVEGDADRLEHPQRLFRGDVAGALDALVGKRECGVVVDPGRGAEQQERQRHARDEHQFKTSKRGVPALSHAESSHQPRKAERWFEYQLAAIEERRSAGFQHRRGHVENDVISGLKG
ncbi:MAG TPA: hypothetical protein VGO01_11790 [Bradyrhizobium sp.]|nr:hypothetical protein [Bradyrhizobium sp.]